MKTSQIILQEFYEKQEVVLALSSNLINPIIEKYQNKNIPCNNGIKMNNFDWFFKDEHTIAFHDFDGAKVVIIDIQELEDSNFKKEIIPIYKIFKSLTSLMLIK